MPDSARLLLDQFLQPAQRAEAANRLVELGALAVPAIASVLDGSARNPFGVALRAASEEVARCALVSARRLGRVAAPLEPLLRAELSSEFAGLRAEAAAALGHLESISDETAAELAALLNSSPEVASEAAVALVRLELLDHAAVRAAVGAFPLTRDYLVAAHRHIERRQAAIPCDCPTGNRS
ncbi:MAG: hypothetical protein U0414_41995 [Polyangiaceae bacterium]